MSIALAGCGIFKANSPLDTRSGLQYSGARAELTTQKGTTAFLLKEDGDDAFNALFENEELCGNFPKKTARERSQFAGAAGVAILIAASSAAIDYWNARQKKVLEDRQKASKGDGEAQIILSPDQFQNGKCLVYRRRAKDSRIDADNSNAGDFDLIVVMRVDRAQAGTKAMALADHFSLKPIFVRAHNSIAQTKAGGDIDLSVGITLHQIVLDQGVPKLAPLGVAATSIGAVPLSGDLRCVRTPDDPSASLLDELFGDPDKCLSSGILPLPTNAGTIVLGIGVQEAGDLGFDIDRAKAQAEAIAAALGPLSGTLLEGHFAREKVRGNN
jgi:hypothetical protein